MEWRKLYTKIMAQYVKSCIVSGKVLLLILFLLLEHHGGTELKTEPVDTKNSTADDNKLAFFNRSRSKSFHDRRSSDDKLASFIRSFLDQLSGRNSSREDQEGSKHFSRFPRGFGDTMKNMWQKLRGKQSGGAAWDLSREEANEVYQDYYECLKKRFKEAQRLQNGEQKGVHAIMALEGERITLKCTVCSRPDLDKLSQQAIWELVRRSDSSLVPIVGRAKRVKQGAQGSLTIKELELDDAGQYICLDTLREYVAIYQVDVKIRERRKMVLWRASFVAVTHAVFSLLFV